MKIALAHDYLNQWGGGERVMALFHEMYPDSVIKTITYDANKVHEVDGLPIETSFIQKLPFGITKYKWYLPLMPKAVESLDFSGYDLVISDSSGFIKGIKTPPSCLHVCYIHTSTRYLTTDRDYFQYTVPRFLHPLMPLTLSFLSRRDKEGAARPDVLIANSKVTAERVEKYYGRKVEAIVFPPVDTSRFYRRNDDKAGQSYLIAGRMVPYKRFDLAIAACNRLELPLTVIGTGPELAALKAMAGPTITFKGKVSDEELREAYATCKAMIFPPLEDAGMTPLECMACGRPVIAFGEGGALESVVAGTTGLFFQEQTEESLVDAIKKFETITWNPDKIIKHADQFSAPRFQAKIKAIITDSLAKRARSAKA